MTSRRRSFELVRLRLRGGDVRLAFGKVFVPVRAASMADGGLRDEHRPTVVEFDNGRFPIRADGDIPADGE